MSRKKRLRSIGELYFLLIENTYLHDDRRTDLEGVIKILKELNLIEVIERHRAHYFYWLTKDGVQPHDTEKIRAMVWTHMLKQTKKNPFKRLLVALDWYKWIIPLTIISKIVTIKNVL